MFDFLHLNPFVLIASCDLNNGVFSSNASPLCVTKEAGKYKQPLRTKGGETRSQFMKAAARCV